ncbi:MAG: ribulose bisphosphate carboxylase small subunit [Alteromonadaceae bacterium]|jgi:ribulose bisphosphate carboxylase small subunit
MSLAIILSSSSFFFTDHIDKLIKSKQATQEQINYAIKLGLPIALKYQLSATVVGSHQWLYYAAQLAETDNQVAFALVDFYHSHDDLDTALIWAKRAVKLNSEPAKIYLSKHYFSQGEYQLIIDTLSPIETRPEALALLIEVAIIKGDYAFINSNIASLSGGVGGEKLLALMYKYQIVAPSFSDQIHHMESTALPTCIANVQMFATTLKNLQKVDKLINEFKDHPLNSYFCFNAVRYIPEHEVRCDYAKNTAIKCDESMWGNIKHSVKTRYLGLMLSAGGANVNAGIMYLDANDNVKVFAHELSHLLGFIDEYALAKNHQQCLKNQTELSSHNISVISTFYQGTKEQARTKLLKKLSWASVIKSTTPILTETKNGWLAGTPDDFESNNLLDNDRYFNDELDKEIIGLYTSDTCNSHITTAFKPLKRFTQLTYFTSDFPQAYIRILNQDNKKYLMPSFHYNVAKSLLKNGQEKLAFIWLDKALSREGEGTPRYEKIKRGVY